MSLSPYHLPDRRALVTAIHGTTKRYFLCLFTTQSRIFEAFYEEVGQYPLQMDIMELDEETSDLTEEYYRSICNSVIEGE